jgi:nitrogen PTS system EIIA component
LAILGYSDETVDKKKFLSEFFCKFRKKQHIRITDYMDVNNVVFLHSKKRNEAMSTLVDRLALNKNVKDKQIFYNAIIAREKIVSTGIGMGVAIPHAKLDNLNDFFIAIGIQKDKTGLQWQSIDKAPVKLVFMIGGPADRQDMYLKVLSKLTIAIKNQSLRKSLMSATTPQDVINLFVEE